VIIKNTGKTASLVLQNADPAAGGNNGFIIHTAGGTTTGAFAAMQTYYGASVVAGTLRLQPSGGNVGIGTTSVGTYVLALDFNASTAAVMSIKNSSTSGYSGAHIMNNSGTVMGHWGYANASAAAPLTDKVYFGSTAAKDVVFTSADTTRMTIFSGGNVGIGTTSAGQKLEVSGVVSCTGFAANDNEIHLRSYTDPTHKLYYASGDIDVFEYNTKLEFRQYNGGGTRIVTMGITSGGTMTVSGDMVAYGSPSDINLKENIKPLEGALEKVMKLQGVSFTWKEDTDTNKVTGIKDDIGFIAQEVQEVVPDLVRKNDNGLLSLRDKGITALLVEAIKEQQKQIDELKYLLQNK
jgi:hypothetical protein